MSDFKSEQIKSVIKDLLKKKKMTYEDVAVELACSTPTVKRILGPEEITLSRLLEFCDLLDITLSDIEVLIKAGKEERPEFTDEQQLFLAKNPYHFVYLMALYESSPQQIAEKHKLTPRSTEKYLISLEKQNLIKVSGKQRVRPTYKTMPSIDRELGKKHFENMIKISSQFFIQNISDFIYAQTTEKKRAKSTFSITQLKVTEESYKAYILEQTKNFEAFLKLSDYEVKSRPENELKVAVVLRANTFIEPDDRNLQDLQNAFGEIRNL